MNNGDLGMKKVIVAFILLFAIVFVGCDGTGDKGKETAQSKEVDMSEAQSFKLDDMNYAVEDIGGIKKLGESGVLYAYCTEAVGANAVINSFEGIPGFDLEPYDTNKEGLVLVLITLGEGESSSFIIDKVEMSDEASLSVYVKTDASEASERAVREYHFVRLDIPVCGLINVYLDGNKVG